MSHFQGDIAWPAVLGTGISFVMIKKSQGTRFKDPRFDYNWTSTAGHRARRGAYHVYDPAGDAATQARNFLNRLELDNSDMPPALDLEAGSWSGHHLDREVVAKGIRSWLRQVEESTGRVPMIYVGHAGAVDFFGGKRPFAAKHPLWFAEYGPAARVPEAWLPLSVWQHSCTGSISGIDGKVDLNVFPGSLGDFHAFGRARPQAARP